MRKIIIQSIGALIMSFFFISGAYTATITLDDTGLITTGISGLNVNGTFYDVSFESGSFNSLNIGDNFPFIGNLSEAGAAVDAIVSVLNSESVEVTGPSIGVNSVNFFVAYAPFGSLAWGQNSLPGANWANNGTITINGDSSLTSHAVFVSSPVPIPAAAWLFGSALGLLGWMRRKAA